MSGIYIPMEMPTNCAECPVNMEVCKRGYKYLIEHMELYDKRADDCPVITVPDHGRLIDADAFALGVINSFMDCADLFDNANSLAKAAEITDAFVRDINDAPTIIPADKENENE